MKYLNIYVQTEYSLLGSAIKLDDYITFAKQNGLSSLAITDDATFAFHKFSKACKSAIINPILGLRLKITEGDYVLAYAMDLDGYKNLLNLSSLQMLGEKINLKEYAKGVALVLPYFESMVVSKGTSEYFLNQVNELKRSFKWVFVGVDVSDDSARWMQIDDYCSQNNIDTVIINRTLFLEEKDYPIYEVLARIDNKEEKLNSLDYSRKCFYKDNCLLDEVVKKRKHLIDNLKVFELAKVKDETFGYVFPKYNLENSDVYLAELAKIGLNKRLKGKNVDLEKYRNRLIYELETIKKMGFSDYFLIVYDYVKYAKTNGICVGPGRGSAASSLVSYAIGITNMDPIEYDLLFERFLNPERLSMPDIDIDFPDDKREEVISYIGTRFGQDKVAHLNAFSTFGARSAIRDVGKVLGIEQKRLAVITSLIPEKNSPSLVSLKDSHDEIKKICESDEDIRNLFDIAGKIENMPRNTTTHASGIVITPTPLTDYTAIQKGLSNVHQTQFEADDISDIGLVKLDVLGLKNLSTISSIISKIKTSRNKTIDFYSIPLDDKKTLALLNKADTDGVFQLESSGMRKLMRELGIDEFRDVINCLALYRPAPMKMIPLFVSRKHGKGYKTIVPALEPVFKDTYGICIYQEQVMQMASVVAGYSLGEADLLRRAIAKKNKDILMKERSKFFASGEKNGYDAKTLDKVFDDIVKFSDANYGLAKAHAVVYAYISYALAYLKANYFPEFMCAMIDSISGKDTLIEKYIIQCKEKGVEISPPSVGKSTNDCEYIGGKVYLPLSSISEVGKTIASKIIEERNKGQFASYEDFIYRTSSFVPKTAFKMLVCAGALDEFGITRKSAITEYDNVYLRAMFAKDSGIDVRALEYSSEEYSFEEMSSLERQALGRNIKYNMFLKYTALYNRYNAKKIVDVLSTNAESLIIAKIDKIKDIVTKKGTKMSFVEISDASSSAEATLFSTEYEKIRSSLVEGNVYLFKVEINLYNGEKNLVIKKCKDISL